MANFNAERDRAFRESVNYMAMRAELIHVRCDAVVAVMAVSPVDGSVVTNTLTKLWTNIGYDRIPNPDPLTRYLASLTEVRRALDYRPPEVLDYGCSCLGIGMR
ncbi:Uncharacterized protein Rs2_49857 [Raphanus sativus]|nr:Uncharacterized protein Rs2_49857 [Raphanus sativus]